jgi:hypothetical protein
MVDLFKLGPLLERAVTALERIAVNTYMLNISAKQIARNSAVQAGTMEPPREPLPYPDA